MSDQPTLRAESKHLILKLRCPPKDRHQIFRIKLVGFGSHARLVECTSIRGSQPPSSQRCDTAARYTEFVRAYFGLMDVRIVTLKYIRKMLRTPFPTLSTSQRSTPSHRFQRHLHYFKHHLHRKHRHSPLRLSSRHIHDTSNTQHVHPTRLHLYINPHSNTRAKPHSRRHPTQRPQSIHKHHPKTCRPPDRGCPSACLRHAIIVIYFIGVGWQDLDRSDAGL
jgi:hypothetical protein